MQNDERRWREILLNPDDAHELKAAHFDNADLYRRPDAGQACAAATDGEMLVIRAKRGAYSCRSHHR